MKNNSGQLLMEMIIVLGIGVLLIASSAGSLYVVIKSNESSQDYQNASSLMNGLSDMASVVAERDWYAIYDLGKGIENQYHIATSSNQFIIVSAVEEKLVEYTLFRRYFYVENVSRDPGTGAIEDVYNINNDDPSTQKIVMVVEWDASGTIPNVTRNLYVTRWKSAVFNQTDWFGGATTPTTDIVSRSNTRFFESQNVITTTPGQLSINLASGCLGNDNCYIKSNIFDTNIASATPNYIMWTGSQPANTQVKFQFASSDCSNGALNSPACDNPTIDSITNWNAIYFGPNASPVDYYAPVSGAQQRIDINDAGFANVHNHHRYFRYLMELAGVSPTATIPPVVNDIIIGYSP
ncbi:MAG: hypothetical protein Q8R26_01080 [bacterium]|nr:hypothetical protein [bacterium]